MVSRFSFFKEVSEIEPRYSIFDRGLLAAFVSERKWKELIIGNCVTLFKSGKQCDYNRQQRQLAFFNEFVADLIYIIEKKSPTPVHSIKVDVRILIYVFGKAQKYSKVDHTDYEKFPLNYNTDIFCKDSRPHFRSFIPELLQKQIFESLHQLSYPGRKWDFDTFGLCLKKG